MKYKETRHYFGMLLIFLGYLASLLIVRPWANIPLNDDWVYARDCATLASTGRLVLTGFESAWALPQIIIGAILTYLFGFSHLILRAVGVVSLAAVVLMTDAYLRYVKLSSTARLIVFAALLFNPVSYILSLSFMTDLPFLFFWLVACFCWDQSLVTGKQSWLVSATVATIIAMAERQFALLIPLSVSLLLLLHWVLAPRSMYLHASWSTSPSKLRRWFILFVGIIFATFAFIAVWVYYKINYIPPLVNTGQPSLALISASAIAFACLKFAFKIPIFLALSSLPLILVLDRPVTSQKLQRMATIITTITVFIILYLMFDAEFPLFGSMISQFGIFKTNGVLLGIRPAIFGFVSNRLMIALAGVGIIMIIPRLIPIIYTWIKTTPSVSYTECNKTKSAHTDDNKFGVVLITSSILYLLVIILRLVYFDRYFLIVLPGIWVMVGRSGMVNSFLRNMLATACVVAFASMSITLAHDYFSWNEARWSAAEKLVHSGIPASSIHAGYEWNGWVVGKEAFPSKNLMNYDYAVAFSPEIDGYKEIDFVSWQSIWLPHDRKIYILKRVIFVPGKGH
ncbi:MAG: hypothetical protein NTX45_22840 [Proteobacteria bacterium]|nr:hypothetical protein [Pseudomonadota bacterium]